MSVVRMTEIRCTARDAALAAKRPAGVKDPADVAAYRRQIRTHVKALERRALAGDQDAIKSMAAMVLAMYVAEHDLRAQIHDAVRATAAA